MSLRGIREAATSGVLNDPGQTEQAIRTLAFSSPTVQTVFDGSLDEIRQERLVRSRDWIKSVYQNQRLGHV